MSDITVKSGGVYLVGYLGSSTKRRSVDGFFRSKLTRQVDYVRTYIWLRAFRVGSYLTPATVAGGGPPEGSPPPLEVVIKEEAK